MDNIIIDFGTRQIVNGKIKAVQGDNTSKKIVILLKENSKPYNLTGKSVVLAMKKIGSDKPLSDDDILTLNVVDAENGEVELPINKAFTKNNGNYQLQISVLNSLDFEESSLLFEASFDVNLKEEFSLNLIESSAFKELKEVLQQASTAAENENERIANEKERVSKDAERDKKIDDVNLKVSEIESEIESLNSDGSVTRRKLANNIKPDFLSDIKYEKNMLDKTQFEVGGLSENGELNTSVINNYCSDFMPIEGNTTYYRLIKKIALAAFYDSDKTFISRLTINADSDITSPENAKYMRYTELKEDMVNNVISDRPVNEYTPYGERYVLGDDYKVKKLSEKIAFDDLSQEVFSNLTFLDNVDLNTIKNRKNYVCLNNVANKPPQLTGTFFLIVEPFISNNKIRWVIQTAIDFFNIEKQYFRKLDLDNPGDSVWKKVNNEGTYTSRLKGKTWVFFGDSITEGVGTTNPSLESYPARIKAKYGINTINKAIAGASWQKDGQYDNICVLTQIENADLSNVDFCTIFAGTNDFGRGALPIGNVDDEVENTLQGAINNAIKMLIEKKSDIKIGLITPMWRERLSAGDNKDSDFNTISGKYLKDYVNAIIKSAEYNHIPVFNLYDNCGINKYNYNTFLADGLHCNAKGYDEILSEKIYDFGNSIF